jgi:hypothetical protein
VWLWLRLLVVNRCVDDKKGFGGRYWESTSFLKEADQTNPITFYDSNTGKPLFIAPKNRSFQDFVAESKSHGWPSFRDDEVVWENVRCLRDGEAVW